MVRRRAWAVLVVAAACLVLFAPAGSASCVAPQIAVGAAVPEPGDPSPAPTTLQPGQQIRVTGRYFRSGCEDTVAYGCSGPKAPADPEAPLRDVVLTLHQGDRSWRLGTADAGNRGGQYAISWQVRIPEDVPVGAATLSAGDARLPVQVGQSA